MKYIGIVGSRRRNLLQDYRKTWFQFKNIYEPEDVIVSGGCPLGGDQFAERIAKHHKVRIIIFRADWQNDGPKAGFIRNTDIAKISDVLVACVAPDRTGGTEDTIRKFKKFNPLGRIYLV